MNAQKFEPPPAFWTKTENDWYDLQRKVAQERAESLSTIEPAAAIATPIPVRNHTKLGFYDPNTGKRGKPDWARFMAVIKFAGGARDGYSNYPSWEMIDFAGNERQGLEDLINRVIKSIPVDDLREAKIFCNLSLNLHTDSRQYNYPVACYKPVHHPKYGKQIRNVWDKKTIDFCLINGIWRVDVNKTLTLQRLAKNVIYLSKKVA